MPISSSRFFSPPKFHSQKEPPGIVLRCPYLTLDLFLFLDPLSKLPPYFPPEHSRLSASPAYPSILLKG